MHFDAIETCRDGVAGSAAIVVDQAWDFVITQGARRGDRGKALAGKGHCFGTLAGR